VELQSPPVTAGKRADLDKQGLCSVFSVELKRKNVKGALNGLFDLRAGQFNFFGGSGLFLSG
jgi:hypothetical protein